ncbi:MAG: universal stress protein [Planctomycetota bacterium]|nr:MAG: universal stress protein [Planctomycetota bacterium]
MIRLKQILHPTDFSDASLRAAEFSVELARQFEARLHLLHVIEDPLPTIAALGGYVPSREELESFARTALETWLDAFDTESLAIERTCVHGHPFAEIVRFARDRDVDLIVIGTHGRGFSPHLLIGSVAEKVVRKSPCPVLSVHPQDFRFVLP